VFSFSAAIIDLRMDNALPRRGTLFLPAEKLRRVMAPSGLSGRIVRPFSSETFFFRSSDFPNSFERISTFFCVADERLAAGGFVAVEAPCVCREERSPLPDDRVFLFDGEFLFSNCALPWLASLISLSWVAQAVLFSPSMGHCRGSLPAAAFSRGSFFVLTFLFCRSHPCPLSF